jgi:hypothetical protein
VAKLKKKEVETEKERGRNEVSPAMIAANNHYAGFVRTANLLRKLVGLSELSWKVQLRQQQQKEKRGDQHVSDSE